MAERTYLDGKLVVENVAYGYVYQEFPKTLYHKDGRTKDVRSREEQNALGKDWKDVTAGPPMADRISSDETDVP